ncbi:UDP-glucose 4-epimerase [Aerococcus viridans]|uniref:NAD-dependent epimerase n=2 Tax=Aerococcus viridans TaxID=1377 RepID=A0AAU8U5P4_9LACT|nr:NAD-dependent epimerase/dehydratase family protein [Aerococcus viridans]AMC01377.1 NAD-dependent epimerase [Aerococcus viridans]EFG48820.1 NAD dependent epimerase/dehydratase family protein [Aerococcus viridans ATCC 11563 = CCUG 4311]SUU15704.1 UDP-glucose 4-epimerase [Aerococcus viridans]
MKRILITGQNSYIGTSFEEWVAQWPEDYKVDKISLRDNRWKSDDWSQYDSILHVAGIAHNSSDKSLEDLYYSVNRDLTEEVALKAKNDGVNHFIFLSSIIVFGTKKECIDENTIPDPDNFYGDSKLQAEQRLEKLNDESFKVAIIRPPMIYGKESKGNYPRLSKLAQKTPIFPNYENRRSMLFISNLVELLRLIIDSHDEGYFHPQNKEYVKTSKLVETIAKIQHHPIWITKIFNWLIFLLKNTSLVKKVFGSLYYDQMLSNTSHLNYQKFTLEESILITEK